MADKNRRIITLPYGEGLERSKGVMVVRPQTFDDIRNMFLFDGKAEVRDGIITRSVLHDDQPADLDVTVLLEPLRSESASMGVGYNTTGGNNREVWLNRMLIDGTAPIAIGLLGVLDGSVTFEPPIIIGADSDNKFFIAHDEPNPTSRLVTQVYDPQDFPQLSNLTGDLDGVSGEQDIFFRGVVRHLSYIFGWGYGNFQDPVRGDVVRVSNSGNSRVFEDFAFFEAGQQGETVMVCRSAGPSLMVFKETETYEIFGYSPDTFGIRLADSLFGCVGSRLAVSIAGNVFFWSTQGPRITTGGPSIDIAVPLDIGGPDPATLVAESEPQDAFAAYDPRTRVVKFVWGQRVYALSIRDPNRPRWSYYELGETAQCSGLFFSTQSQAGGGGPPIGAPENLLFENQARAQLNFSGNPSDGDTVTIDEKVYTFQAVLTDVDGNVLIGADATETGTSLFQAIQLIPPSAGHYATSMTLHPTVEVVQFFPDTVALRAKEDGSDGNDIALVQATTGDVINFTNVFSGDPVTTLEGGVGVNATVVEILFDNIDQIGAEDVEVAVSTDGGANYTSAGRFPANGLFPVKQLITVTLESLSSGKKIQPITDYKFALRYVLGGLFSPGYGSIDPDDWPAISQGSTTTIADPIILRERTGDNDGIWEMLNKDDARIRIDTEIPAGHELLDIEVFLTIREAGPATTPDNFAPSVVTRGDFIPGVTGPFFRVIYNAASPGYPLVFLDEFVEGSALPNPQTEKLNDYQMNFIKGANRDGFSNLLTAYAGPDPQPDEAISFVDVQASILGSPALSLTWQNTSTPDGTLESGGLRVCPAPTASFNPPSGHVTVIYGRNVSTGGAWGFLATVGSHETHFFNFVTFPGGTSVGDSLRVAVRHRVKCFGGFFTGNRFSSDWALNAGDIRWVDTVAR